MYLYFIVSDLTKIVHTSNILFMFECIIVLFCRDFFSGAEYFVELKVSFHSQYSELRYGDTCRKRNETTNYLPTFAMIFNVSSLSLSPFPFFGAIVNAILLCQRQWWWQRRQQQKPFILYVESIVAKLFFVCDFMGWFKARVWKRERDKKKKKKESGMSKREAASKLYVLKKWRLPILLSYTSSSCGNQRKKHEK